MSINNWLGEEDGGCSFEQLASLSPQTHVRVTNCLALQLPFSTPALKREVPGTIRFLGSLVGRVRMAAALSSSLRVCLRKLMYESPIAWLSSCRSLPPHSNRKLQKRFGLWSLWLGEEDSNPH